MRRDSPAAKDEKEAQAECRAQASAAAESPLLCGACRTPVKLTIDADWRAAVVCLRCGRSDSFDAAASEAAAWLKDRRAREIAARLGGAIAAGARTFRFVRDAPARER